MQGRMTPGLDNTELARELRNRLGITVSEWLRLSMGDRLDLIEQWKRERNQ